ncbi:MAG: hypothetical protein PHW24_01595 [Candidatus Moranbacteria bacterium]|nr:hypothetical protein [Candidatus Moranbacteria bacterium]
MKKIDVVFCRHALLGVLSPISFLTEANLQKALDSLENKSCDFVYIAINHLDDKSREAIMEHLHDYLRYLHPQIRDRVHLSVSKGDYADILIGYVGQLSCEEVCINVLASVADRALANQQIDRAANDYPEKLPVIFTTDFAGSCLAL